MEPRTRWARRRSGARFRSRGRGRAVNASLPPPFFSSGAAGELYTAHLEHGTKTGVRQRIEELWARYSPYCPDTHFLSDARVHFVQRTWEMYLACALMDAGFGLERPPPKGPDILT